MDRLSDAVALEDPIVQGFYQLKFRVCGLLDTADCVIIHLDTPLNRDVIKA